MYLQVFKVKSLQKKTSLLLLYCYIIMLFWMCMNTLTVVNRGGTNFNKTFIYCQVVWCKGIIFKKLILDFVTVIYKYL